VVIAVVMDSAAVGASTLTEDYKELSLSDAVSIKEISEEKNTRGTGRFSQKRTIFSVRFIAKPAPTGIS
jgi:hypothetical protein